MAKAMVALRARLKPMRAIAVRSVVTRCAPGFSATELASCNSRTASEGSALTRRTTSSMAIDSIGERLAHAQGDIRKAR